MVRRLADFQRFAGEYERVASAGASLQDFLVYLQALESFCVFVSGVLPECAASKKECAERIKVFVGARAWHDQSRFAYYRAALERGA